MRIEKIFEGLNESQREAVEAPDKPVLVVAGPGTGKTLTIVRRIAYLILKGMRSEEIVALTFTSRAASELKERIRSFCEEPNLFAGTFHFFGLKIIKETSKEDFSILSREEQLDLIKEITAEGRPSTIVERISRIKNLIDEPDERFKKILITYQDLLKEKRALDFDDILIRATELLNDPSINKSYRDSLRYIIVDEYQDINPLQYRMLKSLSRVNLFVVGDPDQSIYSFRGANIKNFLNFEKEYPNTIKIVLHKNYRCQPFIVKASESFIEKNKERIPRNIESTKSDGVPLRIVSLPDEKAEVDFIVQEIEKRVGGMSNYSLMRGIPDGERKNYSFSDFAVLLRTNRQVLSMEAELKKVGIPCYVMGRAFTDALREIILYVEENKDKDYEMLIRDLKDKYKVLSSFINDYLPDSSEELLQWLRLMGPEEDRPLGEAVRLLTMHMAKGLEFRIVFIAGLEDDIMPLEGEDLEEERRLLYVAMTRAKEELFLLHARKRFLYGGLSMQRPSPFLSEIKKDYVETIFIPDRPQREKQLGLF